MFILSGYLWAATLTISANNCNDLIVNEKVLEHEYLDDIFKKIDKEPSLYSERSIKSQFCNKHIKPSFESNLLNTVQITFSNNEIAEFWLPFVLSSILPLIEKTITWNLEFIIPNISNELKYKLPFNSSFLKFNTIIINSEVQDSLSMEQFAAHIKYIPFLYYFHHLKKGLAILGSRNFYRAMLYQNIQNTIDEYIYPLVQKKIYTIHLDLHRVELVLLVTGSLKGFTNKTFLESDKIESILLSDVPQEEKNYIERLID